MSINIGSVHIGEAIKERLRTLKMTQAEFAKILGMKQPSVNAMLKESSMDTERLKLISVQLDYNFFEYFCPDLKKIKENEDVNTDTGTVPVSLYKEAQRKYEELMEANYNLKTELAVLKHELKQNPNIEKEKTAV